MSRGVRIDESVTSDPRLSKSQKEAALAVHLTDDDARLLGLDGRLRPVIEARLGNPRRVVTYALLRNGEPTKVTGGVQEQWRS